MGFPRLADKLYSFFCLLTFAGLLILDSQTDLFAKIKLNQAAEILISRDSRTKLANRSSDSGRGNALVKTRFLDFPMYKETTNMKDNPKIKTTRNRAHKLCSGATKWPEVGPERARHPCLGRPVRILISLHWGSQTV